MCNQQLGLKAHRKQANYISGYFSYEIRWLTNLQNTVAKQKLEVKSPHHQGGWREHLTKGQNWFLVSAFLGNPEEYGCAGSTLVFSVRLSV